LDRNTFLAVVLSLAVLVIWTMYQAQFEPPPGEVPAEEGIEQRSAEEIRTTPIEAIPEVERPKPAMPEPKLPTVPTAEEEILRFEKALYTAELTTRGAGIQRWQLRAYNHGSAEGHAPIMMTIEREPIQTTLLTSFLELGIGDLGQAIFEVESQDDSSASFRYSRDGVTVRKVYAFDGDSYSFRLRLEVENGSPSEVTPKFGIQWPAAKSNTQDFKDEAFTVLHEGKVERHPVEGVGRAGFLDSLFGKGTPIDPEYSGGIDWAGIQTTYFLGVLLPDNRVRAKVRITAIEAGDLGVAEISFPAVKLLPGQATDQEFRAYLGPKEQDRLEQIGGDTIRSIDLGWSWIEPLVLGFNWLLRVLYSIIPNYGVAIILLTILVRLVTMPLTNRQMRSMERMRQVQPKVKELQEKHGGDRQKQSEEMMKLYRSEGVNPLGGCFPMLLQLPW
jgi:YidC/Oxa1 family membrane protein insertase